MDTKVTALERGMVNIEAPVTTSIIPTAVQFRDDEVALVTSDNVLGDKCTRLISGSKGMHTLASGTICHTSYFKSLEDTVSENMFEAKGGN